MVCLWQKFGWDNTEKPILSVNTGNLHVLNDPLSSCFPHRAIGGDDNKEYNFVPRGEIEVKGKGLMMTYFLKGNAKKTIKFPEEIEEEEAAAAKNKTNNTNNANSKCCSLL